MFHKINIQFTEDQINNIGTLGIINKGRRFQDFIESKLFEQLNLNLQNIFSLFLQVLLKRLVYLLKNFISINKNQITRFKFSI